MVCAKVRPLLPAVQLSVSGDSAGMVDAQADLVVYHVLVVEEALVRDGLMGPPALNGLVLLDGAS